MRLLWAWGKSEKSVAAKKIEVGKLPINGEY